MSGEGDRGFPKDNRLLKQKDFDKVYQGGKSYQNQYFHFYFLEKDGPPPRLGLALGKEVGKAVQRNKVKRIIREIFRTNKDLFNNMDLIVKPLAGIKNLGRKEIRAILKKSLRELIRGDGHAGG